ncbi:MAG TPA: hypothetical protein VF155_05110 [Candidatus Dormibacteraeota bacterium]
MEVVAVVVEGRVAKAAGAAGSFHLPWVGQCRSRGGSSASSWTRHVLVSREIVATTITPFSVAAWSVVSHTLLPSVTGWRTLQACSRRMVLS